MPRRASSNASTEQETRRSSARIAASAKPTRSSPRPKRSASNRKSSNTLDTSSSSVSNDNINENLNGSEAEVSNVNDVLISNSEEVAQKRVKLDSDGVQEEEKPVVSENSPKVNDFEVIEQCDVPLPDSDEVKAVVNVQGEAGQLLVGFVQVNKEEIPTANSLEIKHIVSNSDVEEKNVNSPQEDTRVENALGFSVNTVNGSANTDLRNTDNGPDNESIHLECRKIPVSQEDPPTASVIPAAGDVAPEIVTQQ